MSVIYLIEHPNGIFLERICHSGFSWANSETVNFFLAIEKSLTTDLTDE